MRYLSLLLLGPWLFLLAWVYWAAWKRSRTQLQHKVYDLAVVIIALVAAYAFALGGYDQIAVQNVGNFGRESGSIWKQVMPALYGYGAFAAVMIVGIAGRVLFRSRKPQGPRH
ncbi:hypothetical protein [Dyella acidiphila]|uniref:Uncharacterized protein n=1 Tax=Dyella acidiphila TaxID=2775866 RepID=A0ABR9GEF3_9GAMM|nr:hypothetical protein [Dyella acidiphila]MBE1162434.1 hypothetical protein [Dyella acidiphila]